MIDPQKQLMAAVKEAREAGLCVIPPAQDGSKRPQPREVIQLGKNTRHSALRRKNTTTGTRDGSRTGIGAACGKVSGNLEALDFDDLETWHLFLERAEEWGLSELVNKLTTSYLEKTPGGAYHLLYRCSKIGGSQKLATRPKKPGEMSHDKDKIKTLAEVKGEGGYIILAFTYGSVHGSCKPYDRINGSFSDIPTITPEERDDIFALCRSFHVPDAGSIKSATNKAKAETKGVCRPGDDFNLKSTWEEVLAGC